MSIWESEVDPVSETREIFIESGFDTLPARFNVDSNDIEEGEEIGNGLWGPVLKAQWLGRKVAVKKFNKTSQNVLLMAKEVKPMLELRHPNVLKLFGFYLLAKEDLILQCSMIMELMDCDLEKYIQQRRDIQNQNGGRGLPLSDDEGLYIISEIAWGMNHMDKRKYFHQDIKPENVFMKKSDVWKFQVDVKIADFGCSGLIGGSTYDPNAGTLRYKAPEQFDPIAVLKPDKIDVFSFGVLCSYILTGEEPYGGHLVGRTLKEHIRNGGKPAIPDGNLPDDVVGIIRECLDTNPEARPNFPKICGILKYALQKVWKVLRPVSTSAIPDRNLPDDVVGIIRECLDTNPEARPDFPKICGILKYALQKVWKVLRPVATSANISSHPDEFESHRVRRLMSMVDRLGLPKENYFNHVILPEELQVLRLIGLGGEASIYMVRWKGTMYAQKQFKSHSSSPWFEMLPKLSHKNIVAFMGYSVSSGESTTCIVMELLADDLFQLIAESLRIQGANSPPFSEWKSRYIMKEIAEGMAYLHDKGLVHGDLKPANVLVSPDQDTDGIIVKLIDFSGEIGGYTTRYAAPEILRQRSDSTAIINDYKKVDVYGFAMTCCEILGGEDLCDSLGVWKFKEAIMEGRRPLLPKETSQGLKDLLERCWDQDPMSRPTFSDICDFFKKTKD